MVYGERGFRGRMNRRQLLVAAGAAGAAFALIGCGDDDASPTASTTPGSATPEVKLEDGPLVIYNWADYLSSKNIKAFEQMFGVTVDYQVFDDNNAMYAKLAAGGKGYDVIVPGHPQIPQFSEEKLLTKLNPALLPNVANVDPRYRGQFWDANNEWAVAKNWGSDGIIYRTDTITTPPASWADLVTLAKGEARGKTTIMDSEDDIFWGALKATGHSINDFSEAALADAKAWMLDLKPHLLGLVPFGSERALLASGDATVSWSGLSTAPALQAEGVPVQFSWASEGFGFFLDTWAIPASSTRPNLAHAWINFIHSPEAAAEEVAFTYYGTVNKTALDQGLIKADLLKLIQPDQKTLDTLELAKPLDADARQRRDAIWTEFKSA